MSRKPEYPFRERWSVHGEIAVIGWCHGPEGTILREAALALCFEGLGSEDDLKERLRGLNGHFAVSVMRDDLQAAAVDIVRSFPMLLTLGEDGLAVLDDPASHRLTGDPEASTAARFIKSWCVPGNDTLDPGLRQLMAGQYFWKPRGDRGRIEFYFRHCEAQKDDRKYAALRAAAITCMEGVAVRLQNYVSGLKVLVPLSGGYDSRLVLAMLVRTGHPDVTAYTYGRPDSHEVRIARKVCRRLDVDWHFIPYDRDTFRAFFSPEWKSYSGRNHFFTSLPHEQDFFALHSLKEKGKLPADFLALPGFCGDLLGGSVTAHDPGTYNADGLRAQIGARYLDGIESADLDPYDLDPVGDRRAFFDAVQHYFVCNKVSKFIVNSVRVYEHFDGSWMMPLWDRELVSFWYAVPWRLRHRQTLYNEVIFSGYFRPMDIAFRKPDFDSNYPAPWKDRLRSVIPRTWQRKWQSKKAESRAADPNALHILNRMMNARLEGGAREPLPPVNETHAKYFLQSLKK